MIRDSALSKRTLCSVSSNERPKVCPTKARMSPTVIVAPCSSQALCMAPWIRCHFFFFVLFFLQNFSHLLAQPLANFRPILTGSAAESNATNAVVPAGVLDAGSSLGEGGAQ